MRLCVAMCVASFAACGFPRPADVVECTSPADCKSPGAPFCVDTQCVSSCKTNEDCLGTAGAPFCQAATGTCVGCLDATTCPSDKPACDARSNICRGCQIDAECASGVCLEADGQCASETGVVFMTAGPDSSDVGDCTRLAPCKTFPYALSKVTLTRNVIVINGGAVSPSDTLAIDRSVYVDANGATIHLPGVVFSIAPFSVVTLSNLTLIADSGNPRVAATVAASSSLRLHHATVTGAVTTTGGTISSSASTFVSAMSFNDDGLRCTNGTVSVSSSVFQRATVVGMNCQVKVEKSRFDMVNDGSVHVTGGVATIENNLIMNSVALADSMAVDGVAPASTVRFNTFINTSGTASDGTALECDSTPVVTSNIFAYNSMHPFNPTNSCRSRYSLFDSTALGEQSAGTGNQTGDAATFFVDRQQKDFHPAQNSPARGKAETGLGVVDDLEGHPRPSMPDVGAFEAP